jgi:DNA mismatch repair ATPase MutS
MSFYNLLSPVLMFMMPIFILLIPFIILKIKGIALNMSDYLVLLKTVASQHALGKLFFMNIKEVGSQEIIYTMFSLVFYLFSVYNNITVFTRFISNMKQIHIYFRELNEYIEKTLHSMNNYLKYSENLQISHAHIMFNEILKVKINVLSEIFSKVNNISSNLYSINKIKEIGKILALFYELHASNVYKEIISYSIGFNGYIDCLEGLKKNIDEKQMNFCSFINNHKDMNLKKNYYACLKDIKPIKNNIEFKKHLIITGPNASGKTTVLKSVLINVIVSQQFGCGFYDEAAIAPFHHFHCYMNIPDTSGRDSLFEAEARRCVNILNFIDNKNKDYHLCLFDELYSGTNPMEAASTAAEFMKYLVKRRNVSSMLTTHFVKVCKTLNNNPDICNCHMKIKVEKDNVLQTYRLKNGISEVKGAIHVLKKLNYPKEITDNLS